jgi:hypothetical protein
MVQAGRLATATSDSPCSIVIPVSNDPVIGLVFSRQTQRVAPQERLS